MYPNPANDILHISIDGQLDDIEIYNIEGQLVREFDPQGANEFSADIEGLSQGVYFVHVWNKAGQQQVLKMIKD